MLFTNSQSSPLHLIGAGGLASDTLACFKNVIDIVGCWDDALPKGTDFNGIPVMGTINDLFASTIPFNLIITIGNPQIRDRISQRFLNTIHSFPAIIHPDATLYDKNQIQIGAGAIIFPGVFITTKVNIGNHTVIHIGCSIHHDVTIGNSTLVMPGAHLTGNVTVGNRVYIGAGEAVSHGTQIHDGERFEKK